MISWAFAIGLAGCLILLAVVGHAASIAAREEELARVLAWLSFRAEEPAALLRVVELGNLEHRHAR